MKSIFTLSLGLLTLFFCTTMAIAKTATFDLSISGKNFDTHKTLELSDLGEGKTAINFPFSNKNGDQYSFDLQYKQLPENRSFPSNLDITVKDAKGNKLGYLFFAINNVSFLQQLGTFGMIIDVQGQAMDLKFTFDANKKGTLQVADLVTERFVQDTLVPKWGFQMIRPVILPDTGDNTRSQTYSLDKHPYSVNYTLKDMENGMVEFQHNLYKKEGNQEHLLERIYFTADSLATLREAMYAAKYFDNEAGAIKLVFYPAMGQTEPF